MIQTKFGVLIVPCGVLRIPVRALLPPELSILRISKEKLGYEVGCDIELSKACLNRNRLV